MGLFRGFLLVRVYRHIFTGPSSAMDPSVKANKSKAKKFKLTDVTGRTITYACIQVHISDLSFHSVLLHSNVADWSQRHIHIAITSMGQWSTSDNLFNLQEFYETVVDMFEKEPQHPWVINTLKWWNEYDFLRFCFNTSNICTNNVRRQVPGLRPGARKRKKQAESNGRNQGHQNPLDLVLAQRMRWAEIVVGQTPEEPQPTVQQLLRPSELQPIQQGEVLPVDSGDRHDDIWPQPRPIQLTQEDEALQRDQDAHGGDEQPRRAIVSDNIYEDKDNQAEAEDQAHRHKAEMQKLARLAKGKSSAGMPLRRPSLTVTINDATSSSSTKKRVHTMANRDF